MVRKQYLTDSMVETSLMDLDVIEYEGSLNTLLNVWTQTMITMSAAVTNDKVSLKDKFIEKLMKCPDDAVR